MKKLAVFLLLIIPSCVLGQDWVDSKIKKLVFGGGTFSVLPFEKLPKKDGKPHDITIEGQKVTVITSQLQKPVFVNTALCNSNREPAADGGFFFRVTNYLSYAIDGKIFAYEVNYEFFDADSGQEVGAATPGFYVAVKKNNSFMIECVDDFQLKHVPEWVKSK